MAAEPVYYRPGVQSLQCAISTRRLNLQQLTRIRLPHFSCLTALSPLCRFRHARCDIPSLSDLRGRSWPFLHARARGGVGNECDTQLAATNQLNSLRMQLEARMEMAMSNRFRTFLDLNVKAPLVVIPVDLGLPSASSSKRCAVVDIERDLSGDGERGNGKQEDKAETHNEEENYFQERLGGSAERASGGGDSMDRAFAGPPERVSRSSLPSFSASPFHSSAGERGVNLQKASPAAAVVNELLVVDLGSLSLTTARLAHLQRNTGRWEADEGAKTAPNGGGGNGSGGSSSNNDAAEGNESNDNVDSEGYQPPRHEQRWLEQGRDQGRGDAVGLGGLEGQSEATPRLCRDGSSVEVGLEAEKLGPGGGWHANLYDVYNVEIRQVGVLLARRGGDGDGGECSEGWGGGAVDEGGWVAGRASGANYGRGGDAAERWLVNPFDVKVFTSVYIFYRLFVFAVRSYDSVDLVGARDEERTFLT